MLSQLLLQQKDTVLQAQKEFLPLSRKLLSENIECLLVFRSSFYPFTFTWNGYEIVEDKQLNRSKGCCNLCNGHVQFANRYKNPSNGHLNRSNGCCDPLDGYQIFLNGQAKRSNGS